MVWMVKTSDGAEGEARNGRDVGGILRLGSPSSSPAACSFALPYPHHMREGKRDGEKDEACRMTDSTRRCPGSLSSLTVCPFALPFPVYFRSFSICNNVYITKIRQLIKQYIK